VVKIDSPDTGVRSEKVEEELVASRQFFPSHKAKLLNSLHEIASLPNSSPTLRAISTPPS